MVGQGGSRVSVYEWEDAIVGVYEWEDAIVDMAASRCHSQWNMR